MLEAPLSLRRDQVRRARRAGAVVSIVTTSPAEAAPTLPAGSVCLRGERVRPIAQRGTGDRPVARAVAVALPEHRGAVGVIQRDGGAGFRRAADRRRGALVRLSRARGAAVRLPRSDRASTAAPPPRRRSSPPARTKPRWSVAGRVGRASRSAYGARAQRCAGDRPVAAGGYVGAEHVAPLKSVTVLLTSATPAIVGVVSLVRSSLFEVPLSLTSSRSRPDGALGGVASIVNPSSDEAVETLPATSVVLAVRVCPRAQRCAGDRPGAAGGYVAAEHGGAVVERDGAVGFRHTGDRRGGVVGDIVAVRDAAVAAGGQIGDGRRDSAPGCRC